MGGSGLSMLVHYVPLVIVLVAGASYALLTWREHPRLSLVVLVALGLALVGPMVWYALLAGGRAVHQPLLVRLASALNSLLSAADRALLVFAAFFGFYEGRRSIGVSQGGGS